MHIEIHDHTRLSEIDRVFNNHFPYLHLKFYSGKHNKYEGSGIEMQIRFDKTVGQIRKTHISMLLEIRPTEKISTLEREFQNRLGFSVQVMGMGSINWEQSTGLDMLNLHDLNIISRNASDEYVVEEYDQSLNEVA
jgi:hypothetical protein